MKKPLDFRSQGAFVLVQGDVRVRDHLEFRFFLLACRLRKLQGHYSFDEFIRRQRREVFSPQVEHQVRFALLVNSIDRVQILQVQGESTLEELRCLQVVEFDTGDDEGDFAFDFHGVAFFGLRGRDCPLGSIVPERIQSVNYYLISASCPKHRMPFVFLKYFACM